MFPFNIPWNHQGNVKVFLWFQEVLKGNIETKWVNVTMRGLPWSVSLHKEWSFPLRCSPVIVTKSAVSCAFDHNYWINCKWKTSFFVQWHTFVQRVQSPMTLVSPCTHMYALCYPLPHVRCVRNSSLLTNPSTTT